MSHRRRYRREGEGLRSDGRTTGPRCQEHLDVQLSDDVLTIKGEKQDEKEEKTKDRYVSERRYGSFRRSLQVPGGVDADKIEASFKGGVLTVILPKSPEAQKKEKTIPVSVK